MKNKKFPMRRCVGCMESKPQKDLIRIAWYEGILKLDFDGRAKGRGVYLCRNAGCIEKAKKRRSLQRSFQTELPKDNLERIFLQLEGETEDDQK